MCGRYALHASPEVVALQFGLDSAPEFKPSYNIAPAAEILVVRPGAAARARWGLRGRFVNLRAETVLARFRASGRCLVPASGFYEWKAEGRRKQPYYFSPKSDALLALAALWERDTCSLITTEPNAVVRGVHERMPLIVPRELYQPWLRGDERILQSAPQIELRAHPVGLAVNRAENDSPRLIEPVELARGLFD
ncbi:MAG TPA: SOS response-associated peptidase [Burkholderiales bacterium]|nr:SOS response-associated peptidase [Burkholderiales bacterium]